MLNEPSRQRIGISTLQNVDHDVLLKVHQERAIVASLTQSPVVDAQNPGGSLLFYRRGSNKP